VAAAPTRPNFVFIETDDQDYTLGSLSVMKNLLNDVVAEGTLFTQSYVTSE
jgi:hypothetical protein